MDSCKTTTAGWKKNIKQTSHPNKHPIQNPIKQTNKQNKPSKNPLDFSFGLKTSIYII